MFRCTQCGAVLSSMWRLRQHLADHSRTQQTVAEGKGDHVYGRSSRRLQNTVKIKEKGAVHHQIKGKIGQQRKHVGETIASL